MCVSTTWRAHSQWRVKNQIFSTSGNSQALYHQKHAVLTRSPTQKKMKLTIKRVVEAKNREGVRPLSIQSELATAFNPAIGSELLYLSEIQRVSLSFRSKTIQADSLLSTMKVLVAANFYGSDLHDTRSFAFCYRANGDSSPNFDRACSTDPTTVVVTTRVLPCRIQKADSQTLHVVATFMLSKPNNPVIVVGVSDCARSFRLAAAIMSSQ